MGSPVGIGDCITIIDKAIEIYKKIRDAPRQIDDVTERMVDLRGYMTSLRGQVVETPLARLSLDVRDQINTTLERIKADVRKIDDILEKWRTKRAPGGLTFRFDSVNRTFFSLGSSPKELRDLTENIDRRKGEIVSYMIMLNAVGVNKLLSVPTTQKQPFRPPPRKEKYSIIFIDSHNKGRSLVAQAYAQLVREWTVRTKNPWLVDKIDSAGLLVAAGSATAALQTEMGMHLLDGGKAPVPTALAALFDNDRFNYPYKKDVRQTTESWKSRGLPKDLFTTYDFILLFNTSSAANLERLKTALPQKKGKSATENGMGEIVMLGEYGKSGNKQIWDPPSPYTKDGWNKVMANIKVSFREFLKKETGWAQPPIGAKQD